jgi:hypothetical protein
LVSEIVFGVGLEEDHSEVEVAKLVAKLPDDAEAKMVSCEDLSTFLFRGMSDFNKVETIIRYLNSILMEIESLLLANVYAKRKREEG